MRMHWATSMIENGFVHVPVQADWLPEYQHETAIFPDGKYDDQADSTSQALDSIKNGMFSSWACELASECKNAQNTPVAEPSKCKQCSNQAPSCGGIAGVRGGFGEGCNCDWSRIILGKTTVRIASSNYRFETILGTKNSNPCSSASRSGPRVLLIYFC